MANKEHLDRLLTGVADWNLWRADNPEVTPILEDAVLKDVTLTDANLFGANLSRANLSLADLTRANLRLADLSGADLSGANLSLANLILADVTEVNLSRADLRRTDLTHANLRLAILSDAYLRLADLTDANLSLAHLTEAHLNGANLCGAILNGAILNGAILCGANLTDADLRRADMSGADLRRADLTHANLSGANLTEANLSGAILSGANLTDANLTDAYLFEATVREAILSFTNMTNSYVRSTTFTGVSLTGITGLSKLNHNGPSHIDIDTLERTAANLGENGSKQHEVELFLEHAGVLKEYIEFFRSRVGQPIEFCSCFISYSTKDQTFADRLCTDLRQKGIRCWLATKDLKIGDKFRTRINEAIRVHDKLMVVLSEESIKSSWVESEIEAAFERERRDGATVLFPIRLDDAIMSCDEAWASEIRRIRNIGDFRSWKDHDEYSKSLERLIRDLRAENAARKSSGAQP